jgi:23S rRNA (cytidine1920-2'-O)/16S rRNA (cytidine1409-2'-O)-methyltransferase
MTLRRRADRLLVERGLFASRARAKAAIAAGLVTADDIRLRRASDEIAVDAMVHASPEHPWVSRGGVKLSAALDHFGFDPRNCVCLDVGASTGGFSDVLISRGATCVYAVDVGRGQLHPRLSQRPEIVSFPQTDIRRLDRTALAQAPSFIVIDVSFVSLKLVLPAALGVCRSPAYLLALIKPQFEAGRRHLKKGIVRDAEVRRAVCEDLVSFVVSLGWAVVGIAPSALPGRDGNREFFLAARRD